MAELTGRMPAEDAMTIFGTVDALARCADPDDPRSIDARRVDALVDLCRPELWRRLLTDPVSGVLLDYGTRVYRPPQSLARHVRARDPVCCFPGCRQPAEGCDLDHGVPYPHGPTCAANLIPLCRHHHRAKTLGGWRWRRQDDASFVWTAPAGYQCQVPIPPVLDDPWLDDPPPY